MDIQYSVKPAGSEIRKEKIKSRLFGLFITLFIMSALFVKMFVFVPMLNEHPTFGDNRRILCRKAVLLKLLLLRPPSRVHDGRFLYITLYGVCCLCCAIALNLRHQNRRFVLIYKSCRK